MSKIRTVEEREERKRRKALRQLTSFLAREKVKYDDLVQEWRMQSDKQYRRFLKHAISMVATVDAVERTNDTLKALGIDRIQLQPSRIQALKAKLLELGIFRTMLSQSSLSERTKKRLSDAFLGHLFANLSSESEKAKSNDETKKLSQLLALERMQRQEKGLRPRMPEVSSSDNQGNSGLRKESKSQKKRRDS